MQAPATRRLTLPTSPAAASQARPRRLASVSRPPQRPCAALGSCFYAPELCRSRAGSKQPTISSRRLAFRATLGEQPYFASPAPPTPWAQGLLSSWRSRALRLPAAQGPNRAYSSRAAYTMRSVGIPQQMTPRPLSCADLAVRDWWSSPLRSQRLIVDFVN